MLPLFYEKSDTPAMIKHGMDVHRRPTEYLNPGQIPVITFDQPVHARQVRTLEMTRSLWRERLCSYDRRTAH